MVIICRYSIKTHTRLKYKRGMWIDHLLAEKCARSGHASETIGRFVESSAELNCVMAVRHGSQESDSDSDVYKITGVNYENVKIF